MPVVTDWYQAATKSERRILDRLTTPAEIQSFLGGVAYSTEEIYRCPLRVLRDRTGHCFDGAVFAAAALRRIGYPPKIVELLPNRRDDDHILAVYRSAGGWGAVAQSNFVGLRWREPVYRSLRELVMSYFEDFYNLARERTLRGYTFPLDLRGFDARHWTASDAAMRVIAGGLDKIPRRRVLAPKMVRRLTLVDERSYRAGLLGSVRKGLHKL